ncbi:arylamine N-acetyltransferase [Natrinema sp. 1APR25-10V2]|uniref:arylamine N-acetyltransferase family protein n=1 Tax=Natrinema sp. 1APR25-10V2 TaxID=2951081 RepID=UPI002874F0B8|nr:arylamine N-acetyltransferase [Natrinema sp. 1APR25-10V2]MDS0475811.1 arylamine N-acetyltransferase [Natrinema sp. 1APR25-10V2]
MNVDRYLDRIGLTDPGPADLPADLDTLHTIVPAHATSVPFENLDIVGHPHGDYAGDGVSLSLADLYEKVVTRRRGGFCFEINGLFNRLLTALGFDADRCAARIGGDDDSLGHPPANHHTNVVHLDRAYLVDVGTGTPQIREPIPFDGTPVEDAVGISWRVVPSDAPLSDYVLQKRDPGADGWELRYRFQTEPRTLSYFEATCEFLANRPNGTFTTGPIVKRSTRNGWVGLDADTLTRRTGTEESATAVDPEEWDAVLEREFAISLPSV